MVEAGFLQLLVKLCGPLYRIQESVKKLIGVFVVYVLQCRILCGICAVVKGEAHCDGCLRIRIEFHHPGAEIRRIADPHRADILIGHLPVHRVIPLGILVIHAGREIDLTVLIGDIVLALLTPDQQSGKLWIRIKLVHDLYCGNGIGSRLI